MAEKCNFAIIMHSNEVYRILQHISSFISLVPFAIVLLRIKAIDKKYYFLAFLICFAFLTEVGNLILVKLKINNYLLLRTYSVVEVISLSFFYFKMFRLNGRSGYFLIPIPLFFIVAYIDYKINGAMSFDNYAAAFESITFSLITLWSFYYVLKKMPFEKVTSEPFFWFNTGILMYFGGNLVLFVFDNYLLKYQAESHLAMWGIHSVLNIIYNIVLAIGFWKTRRR